MRIILHKPVITITGRKQPLLNSMEIIYGYATPTVIRFSFHQNNDSLTLRFQGRLILTQVKIILVYGLAQV